ncbi:MAG: DUF3078 domain-containing protein [Alistipes sp.]|nr:DUF3078 domain-containing protein [Alistipes sp.]
MKRFFTFFAISAFASIAVASAQATVESATPHEQVTFANEIKTETEAPTFKNEAQIKAEKAALRKERNTFEFNASLNASLAHFNGYWRKVNGNTNSLTGVGNILFTHQYKKDKFVLDNKITGKLGYTYNFLPQSEGASAVTKSQDEWFISSAPAYTLSKDWNVGGSVSLRSQFANGYNGDGKLTSMGFAPAYLTLAAGFTYVCPNKKFPIKINISPISMNATYVTSEAIRSFYFAEKGFKDGAGNVVTYDQYVANNSILSKDDRNTPYAYGLTLQNGVQRYEGGSSIQIDFDKTFGEKGIFRYRTTLYSFYGWINQVSQQQTSKKWNNNPANASNLLHFDSIVPTVRWENTIDIKASKYFTTQFYFQLYYNKAQNKHVQTQTVLGVGLAYTFKNKK